MSGNHIKSMLEGSYEESPYNIEIKNDQTRVIKQVYEAAIGQGQKYSTVKELREALQNLNISQDDLLIEQQSFTFQKSNQRSESHPKRRLT